MPFSISLAALFAFLIIAAAYGFAAIGRAHSERLATIAQLLLLTAIAGLCGYHLLTVTEHALAIAARV